MTLANEIYRSEKCAKRTKNQHRIIIALMSHAPLSLTQLSNKLGIRYKTLQKEIDGLLHCMIILKDEHKLYSINPTYGQFLIDEGILILGLQTVPDKVRLITLMHKLRTTVNELMICLKRVCTIAIGISVCIFRAVGSSASFLILTMITKIK
jgi:biotin operon repressor